MHMNRFLAWQPGVPGIHTTHTKGSHMPKQLKNPKVLAPLGVICVLLTLWSCMFYPMLHATPKNIPFAILSLDKGAKTAAGTVNAGKTMVQKITSATSASDGDSPIAWTEFKTRNALDKAMDDNDYYAAVVISKDFTAKQVAAKQAQTQAIAKQVQAQMEAKMKAQAQAQAQGVAPNATAQNGTSTAAPSPSALAQSTTATKDMPVVTIITNSAKNPTVTQNITASITSTLKQAGVNVKTSAVHDYDLGNASGAAMLAQLTVAPTVLMSAVCTLIMYLLTKPRKNASRKERLITVGVQACYAAVLSLCVAGATCFLITVVGGMTIPVGAVLPYLWICSFCLMLLVLGMATIVLPLAALAMLTVMFTMSTGYTAFEALPAFWQDWIYPWTPARYIADGIRSIVFLGQGAFNSTLVPLAVCAAIGLVAAGIGMAVQCGRKAPARG